MQFEGKKKQNENLEEIQVKELMLQKKKMEFFFACHSTGMRLHQRSKAILDPDNPNIPQKLF